MQVPINFKCPWKDCDGDQLDEVVQGVIQYSEIESLESEGGESISLNYGETTYSTDNCDGIYCFQCQKCGRPCLDADGEFITDENDLLIWLNKRGM